MKWALEYEEIEQLYEVMKKLEKEDAALILSLVEKVSFAAGQVEGMTMALQMKEPCS